MTEYSCRQGDARHVRLDASGRFREEVFMAGPPGRRIFACLYAPVEPPVGGVLICPSLHAELLALYRDEVLLARELASRGFAVLRFHYQGCGHSDGETADTTLDAMCADASEALKQLQSRARPPALAFIGARIGAIVAGGIASHYPEAPLVLWEPVVEPRRFFREASRQLRMHDLKEGRDSGAGGGILDAVRESGWIDVLGYPISNALVESAVDRTLTRELGEARRDIYLCQLGPRTALRREYQDALDKWNSRGVAVDIELVPCEEVSWFTPDARHSREDRHMLVDLTTEWLMQKFTKQVAS
jgi:alpha/beta superfamily hydrolase